MLDASGNIAFVDGTINYKGFDDVELDLDEAKATAHSRAMSILRSVAELVLVVICFYIRGIINPFTFLAGLFGRKIGALAVPYIFDRSSHKEENDG